MQEIIIEISPDIDKEITPVIPREIFKPENLKHHEFLNFILRRFFGILGGLNQIALLRLILEF